MTNRFTAGCALALVVSSVSFASIDTTRLARQSLVTSERLNNFAQTHYKDACAGDVMIAGAYLKSAGEALLKNNNYRASVSLAYTKNELQDIGYNRSYCVALSPGIKPYLAEVIMIQNELEIMAHSIN